MIELQSVDEYGNLYAIDTFLTVGDAEQALAELKKAKDKLDLGLITQQQFDSLKVVLSKIIK